MKIPESLRKFRKLGKKFYFSLKSGMKVTEEKSVNGFFPKNSENFFEKPTFYLKIKRKFRK